MGRKYLTKEQLEAVQANPYVAKATAARISYTPEFKRLARKELLEGKHIMDVFRDAGFDVGALGWPRIDHFKSKVLEFADPDFSDQSQKKEKRKASSGDGAEDDVESIKQRLRWVEHQLAYARQEVEFVKKIQMADLEAQKQWGSKRRQK